MEERGPTLKPRTRTHYQYNIDRFIKPALGRLPAASVGLTDIAKAHRAMADTPRQANGMATVLSSPFSWAIDNKHVEFAENPCARLKRFREGKRERYLSIEELTRLAVVEAERRHSAYALNAIRLLVLTGARSAEILTLKWAHVALDHQILLLPDSKTGAKTIHLNEQAITVLRSIERLENNPYVIIGKRRGSHLVGLQKIWGDIRAEAGLDDLRIHDLRHSFASFAAKEGASLVQSGKLLGHASPNTTARYSHIADANAHELNQTVGESLGAAMRPKPATPGVETSATVIRLDPGKTSEKSAPPAESDTPRRADGGAESV